MQSRRFLTPALLIAVALLTAPACAERAMTSGPFPPAADLSVSPKPRTDPAVLDSEEADVALSIALEARGDALALQVSRLCRFFDRQGMPGLDCPPPEKPE